MSTLKTGGLHADAIILATPTHTHVELAKELIGSGLAVLIEKPLAVTGVEGRNLLKACLADQNGVYMVGHHRRHNCYVMAIKEVLDEKQLGTVVAVNGGEIALHSSTEYLCRPLTIVRSLGDAQI